MISSSQKSFSDPEVEFNLTDALLLIKYFFLMFRVNFTHVKVGCQYVFLLPVKDINGFRILDDELLISLPSRLGGAHYYFR